MNRRPNLGPRLRASSLVSCLAGIPSILMLACHATDPNDPPAPLRAHTVVHLIDRSSTQTTSETAPIERANLAGVWMEVLPSKSVDPAIDRFRTSAVHVAEHDILEFAIGVATPPVDRPAHPVSFSVRARANGTGTEVFHSSLEPHDATSTWRTFQVPLDDFAGDEISFEFETRGLGKDPDPTRGYWGDPILLQRGAIPRAREPSAMAADRPSIVLISLDTLRARSMSAYGREIPTTPEFESLAESGTLFANASTGFSSTYGAHIGMLTGRYYWSSELQPLRRISDGHGLFLAERLRSAGYSTAAFTEDALLRGASGFWNGFGTYFENKEVMRGAGAASDTFGRALDWARTHADRPFFLFVHTYQVHAPYEPPLDHVDLFPTGMDEQVQVPLDWDEEKREQARHGILETRRAYEQEVRYLDGLLGDFVQSMKAALGDQRVVFVITADHGEEFLEHGGVLHRQLYQEVLHVPLLIIDTQSDQTARRVDEVVSLVDIVPTITELSGVREGVPADGISLAPLLAGRDLPSLRDRAIWATAGKIGLPGSRESFAARHGRWKCVFEEGWPEPRCFDLSVDAAELAPLSPTANPEFAPLVVEIEAYRSRLASSPADPFVGDRIEVDPESLKKLEALGYTE